MKKTAQLKILTLFFVICMSVPLLAGCVQDNLNDPTDSTVSNSESEPIEQPTDNSESKPAEETTGNSESKPADETTGTEVPAECSHEYEKICSAECIKCDHVRPESELDHSYPDTQCGTIACEVCGKTKDQEHEMNISASTSTATLLSAGTLEYVCGRCGNVKSEELDAPIDPSLLGMPIVYFTDLEGAEIPLADLKKSQGEIIVKIKYVSNNEDIPSFEGATEIKIQGSSSATYIKKNFTIKLFEDETLEKKMKIDFGWGKESKYCMKANYIDITQARNIVAAQMFAQIVASRDNINEGLKNAPNYGLIDGFPILVYINGTYHGIYTMNIPKDEWQFAMEGDETAKEAMLMADGWGDYTAMKKPIGEVSNIDDFANYKFEIEYASNEDDVIWIRDSFNELVELVNSGNKEKIRAELHEHLDIEAAIDNMIFTYFINAADNIAKNILWATYDGKVWIPSMYDMDGSFGNYWNGQPIGTTKDEGYPQNANAIRPYFTSGIPKIGGIKLWEALCICYPEEVEARYTKLRESILTVENTEATFNAFFAKTHPFAYISDVEKWDTEENTNKIAYDYAEVTRNNMYDTTAEQLQKMDAFFLNLVK